VVGWVAFHHFHVYLLLILFFYISVMVLTMLAANTDGFFAFLAACYELTSVLFLCFSCLMALLFVANKFFFFFGA